MPKPVLSDSLFNADDVATAVLSEANLQIANSNLGVTDISSSFTLNTSTWGHNSEHMYLFNGFVFLSSYLTSSSTPSSNTVIYSISNSDYRPIERYRFPATGYQADSGSSVEIRTDGDIVIKDPTNTGDTTYFVVINGWYRID
jgi:hypothetical protein